MSSCARTIMLLCVCCCLTIVGVKIVDNDVVVAFGLGFAVVGAVVPGRPQLLSSSWLIMWIMIILVALVLPFHVFVVIVVVSILLLLMLLFKVVYIYSFKFDWETSIILLIHANNARIRSWNQPVLSNDGKVSCSMNNGCL